MSLFAAALAAAALGGLIFAPGGPAADTALIVLIGFGFGPVFPNMIAIGAARFPAHLGRMTSAVSAGGSLGGMVVPALMGLALARRGAAFSMEVALAATALMLLLLTIAGSSPRRR
jgi:fucose permease